MGLLDRFLKGGSSAGAAAPAPRTKKPKQEAESFFLDADSSASMGNVDFMRRSNTIRRTLEASIEKLSEGMPGTEVVEASVDLTGGVPKPVKKTFAQTMSAAELDQRMKGSAVGVNVTGGPAVIKLEREAVAAERAIQPQITQTSTAKPGAIDPFKQMAKELNG